MEKTRILFLGDSITDAGRSREGVERLLMGQGYPTMCAGRLGMDHPDRFEFVNTGVSGNRITDVYARIKRDCWNHKPDVISLLVGINDVGHEINRQDGVEDDRFETVYRMLLEDTKKVLPKTKFILMEPFCLAVPHRPEDWAAFRKGAKAKGEIVKKLAEEFGCAFVPLQDKFDRVCNLAPARHWIGDGVHPTPAGNQLIADRWLKAIKEIM